MIGYYKYSRPNIVNKIRQMKKTCDGYYFFPDFQKYNEKRGTLNGSNDTKYYYPRSSFNNKMCFNEQDIECYLSKKDINYNINKMNELDKKIEEVIGELKEFGLFDDLPNYEFNLGELIDTTIFMFNCKE